jgi:hypothetical protein
VPDLLSWNMPRERLPIGVGLPSTCPSQMSKLPIRSRLPMLRDVGSIPPRLPVNNYFKVAGGGSTVYCGGRYLFVQVTNLMVLSDKLIIVSKTQLRSVLRNTFDFTWAAAGVAAECHDF